MIKSRPISVSPQSHVQDIHLSTIRGYKYYRVIQQFNYNEDTSRHTVAFFFKQVKKAKTLKTFKLLENPDFPEHLKSEMVRSALKVHSQKLQELEISLPLYPGLNKGRSLFFSLKNLKTLHAPEDISYLKNLVVLRKIENLFINLLKNQIKTRLLCKVLAKLNNLQNLCTLILPSDLDKLLNVLGRLSLKLKQPINYQIITKEVQEYNRLESIDKITAENITKLSLQYLNSESVIQNFFPKQHSLLQNLRNLKLGFGAPDLGLVSYLENIKEIPLLEKLSLSITECWDTEFFEGVFRNLQLPESLQTLKLNMPLSFKNLILKYVQNIGDTNRQKNKYQWRSDNFFEKEPLFISFFNRLERAKCLKKIELSFQIMEAFNSYYTNFFVSVLNKLENLSSFVIHVSDYTLQETFNNQVSQPFDLSLLFKAFSRHRQLENIEVLVPNLLFEEAKIDFLLPLLKSFAIGIIENEEEGAFQFLNVSNIVNGWLKRIALMAPNLTNLVLDFVEVTEEQDFLKRFMQIERFKELKAFCGRFKIERCSIDTVKKAGKMLQSLQRLNTVVTRFVESDRDVLKIKKYLHYHSSLRDILVSFDYKNWIGRDYKTDYNSETEYGECDDDMDDSSTSELLGFDSDDR